MSTAQFLRGRAFETRMAILALGAAASSVTAGVKYTVVDLGPGSSSQTNAINASGESTGIISISQAFRNDGFVTTPLEPVENFPKTYGNGINSSGVVAGRCVAATITFPVWIPVIWKGTTPTPINMGGTEGGEALDISDSGQVVGWSDSFGLPGSWNRAFLWTGGPLVDLGTLDEEQDGTTIGQSYARAINNNDQIVGWAATDDYPGFGIVGFLLTIGEGMQSLGLYLGRPTDPTDLNDNAIIVGSVDMPNGDKVAWRWENGEFTNLGTLGGTRARPMGINNLGQIVGDSTYDPQAPGLSRAFIWEDGVMTDLNSLIDPLSGWTVGYAFDINDAGQIAAMGSINDGRHAIRLDPIVTTVPGDFNGDGVVDGDDLGTLLGDWGPCPGCETDLNGDGEVDGDDLGTLLGVWGSV